MRAIHFLGSALLCLFFAACGTETSLYTWTQLEARNFEPNTQKVLDSLSDSIRFENYAIQLNLHARILDTYRSSGGFAASKDLKSNHQIDSIRIFSLLDFNDTLGADTTLLTDFFTARYPQTAGERHTALDFVRAFAQSDSVEGYFELFLEQEPQFASQQFVIELDLQSGQTLIDTTGIVKFLE